MESSHITFELEAKILDIVAELKAVSDDEGETSEEEKTAQIDGDGGSGGELTQDPTSSKRSSPDSGLRKSGRLTQWRRANNMQQRVEVLTTAVQMMAISSPPF